jgi:hypothetical protein
MPIRMRPTNPNATPAITDPALLRQLEEQDAALYQETTLCECGCDISTRHLERHRRSKNHRLTLNWLREQRLIAIAQNAQNTPVVN